MANLGIFDSIEQARAAFGESASAGDYVVISGVNYYWNPLELNWFTERYTVTTPVYDIPETTDKGTFASMDAVWAAFPDGGSEGDYLTIGSDRYHWNKWEQLWESSGETQVPVVNHYVTNLGTFATMDEVWNLYPDGGHDGEWLTINSIRYYWDIYNQLWASEDGTATYLELHDVTNRGSYTDIEAVYSALPNGGAEGDYIYIDGIKYRWNKYTHVWMGVPDEPAAGRTNYNFNGDVTIQNNLTVGGILRAKGMITKYDRIYQYLLQSTSDFESSTNKTVDDFKKEVSDALSQAGKSADNAAYANEASLAAEAINLTKDSPEWDKILRKDIPNNAQELITFLKGIAFGDGSKGIDAGGNATLADVMASQITSEVVKSSDFRPNGTLLDGAGFGIYHDEHGRTHVSADILEARVKAIFADLEVRKLSFTAGDVGYTSAGCKVTKVIKQSNGDYRCYFLAESDGVKISNDWHVGDQAMCRTSNIISKTTQMAQNRYYWRLVVGIGEEALEDGKFYYFIDLSNTAGALILSIGGKDHTCVGYDTSVVNDEPKVEDSLVQLGSQTDPDRQYAYIVYVSTGERVDYNGVNDYDLSSHITTKMGVHGTTVHSEYFEILGPTGVSTSLVSERGAWKAGETYGHYDHVSYNNATWLCNVGKGQTTTEEPTDGSTVWIKETYGVKGDGVMYVDITSVRGNIMLNGQGSVTLTASVYQDGKDITATITPNRYSWTRDSGETESDATWNSVHIGIGNTVTITADEVFRKANFTCIVSE